MREPERFGEYVLLERLRASTRTEVFLAVHEGGGFHKHVALERTIAGREEPNFADRFLERASRIAAISHPGVCSVYAFGQHERGAYVASELVLGPTLEQLHDRMPGMPWPVARHIVSRVLESLAYVHGKRGPTGQPLGLVHGRLSSRSVLISPEGDVKLTLEEADVDPDYVAPSIVNAPAETWPDRYAAVVMLARCRHVEAAPARWTLERLGGLWHLSARTMADVLRGGIHDIIWDDGPHLTFGTRDTHAARVNEAERQQVIYHLRRMVSVEFADQLERDLSALDRYVAAATMSSGFRARDVSPHDPSGRHAIATTDPVGRSPDEVHLIVELAAPPSTSLIVGTSYELAVSLEPPRALRMLGVSSGLAPGVAAEITGARTVDVIVICPAAAVTPLRRQLRAPPALDRCTFALTPRRTGPIVVEVSLLVANQIIHSLELAVSVREVELAIGVSP